METSNQQVLVLSVSKIIRHFLDEIQANQPIWAKTMAPNAKRLIFTKKTRLDPAKVDQTIHQYLIQTFGSQYAIKLERMVNKHNLLARRYEYIIQICRKLEECYCRNNRMMLPILEKITILKDCLDDDDQNVECFNKWINRCRKHSCVWILATEHFKKNLQKCCIMIRFLGKHVQIPQRVNRGFPLRYKMTILYYLILFRIHVLECFECFLKKIQALLTKTDDRVEKPPPPPPVSKNPPKEIGNQMLM